MAYYEITRMDCNHIVHPLGVDTPQPVFHWEYRLIADTRENAKLYRLMVSRESVPDADPIWDSDAQALETAPYVFYAGPSLVSLTTYWWRVGLSMDGDVWDWSHAACFETGLLSPSDWTGDWIGDPAGGADTPAPFFRREFMFRQKPVRARVIVCGLGYHEVSINGYKLGDAVLSPGFTQYDKRALYTVYDATAPIQAGCNIIGVLLGNGMFHNTVADEWAFEKAPWVGLPRFRLELNMEYANGGCDRVSSDPSWRCGHGPIQFNALRSGQVDDSRLMIPGWDRPGYDDSRWTVAVRLPPPGGSLKWEQQPPIRVIETVEPVSQIIINKCISVWDMGVSISGWACIQVEGCAGAVITLRYGERLYPDGRVDQEHIAKFIPGRFQTDAYTLKGEGVEVWEPRFTYHGFQYVEATVAGEATVRRLDGRLVHTDLPDAGSFSCSLPLLNRIQAMCRRSILTNYHSIPTDCPHREKNGWTGDSHLSALPTMLNFDSYNAHHHWVAVMIDTQQPDGKLSCIAPTGGWGYDWGTGPAWDSALILIPWQMYVQYGDKAVLADAYPAMKRYLAYLDSRAENNLLAFGLGDWNPPMGRNEDFECPLVITDTAYYFTDYRLVAEIARVLGYLEDHIQYAARAADIRRAFREAFLLPGGGMVKDCQTSLACTLYFDLADVEEYEDLTQRLVQCVHDRDDHVWAGILGTQYLLPALSMNGYSDLALKIVNRTDFPGWGWWSEQGATTLWGNWDGKSSRNHHMFSTVSGWFYETLGGIRADAARPGYRHFFLEPHPAQGLDWAECSRDSPYGRITSRWKVEDGWFMWEFTVPPGSEATIIPPSSGTYRLNGNETTDSKVIVISGSYILEQKLQINRRRHY